MRVGFSLQGIKRAREGKTTKVKKNIEIILILILQLIQTNVK